MLFKTEAFRDPEEILSQNINRIHGYELAMWLYRELETLGFKATDASDEDFGWYFDVEHGGHHYFCTTSIVTEGSGPDEGHVTVSKRRSILDRILWRNQTTSDDLAVRAITDILRRSAVVGKLERHSE